MCDILNCKHKTISHTTYYEREILKFKECNKNSIRSACQRLLNNYSKTEAINIFSKYMVNNNFYEDDFDLDNDSEVKTELTKLIETIDLYDKNNQTVQPLNNGATKFKNISDSTTSSSYSSNSSSDSSSNSSSDSDCSSGYSYSYSSNSS